MGDGPGSSPSNKPPHTRIFGTLAFLNLLLCLEWMVFLPLLIVLIGSNSRIEVPVGLLEVEKRNVVSEVEGDACQSISTERTDVCGRKVYQGGVKGRQRLTLKP